MYFECLMNKRNMRNLMTKHVYIKDEEALYQNSKNLSWTFIYMYIHTYIYIYFNARWIRGSVHSWCGSFECERRGEIFPKPKALWIGFSFLWHIGFYCYGLAKRTKFLLAVVYGSYITALKPLRKLEKCWIHLYDHFRTSWIA